LLKRILVNNQIRAREVRVIDVDGKQIGVMSLEEALQLAKERNLDLVQVTQKVQPPVCKIIDRGKYLYQLQKKEKKIKKKSSQVKGIRLSFKISDHDLETKVKQAEKFLKEGDKIKVELILRGREKGLEDFAREKIQKFVEILKEKVPIKIEQDIKRRPGGLTMIITKG
jgi:translation initiation factor IF-3